MIYAGGWWFTDEVLADDARYLKELSMPKGHGGNATSRGPVKAKPGSKPPKPTKPKGY
jgi:hypothetical protein